MRDKRVVVMQGCSGSGKSTYAKGLAQEATGNNLSTKIVSADNYFMVDGVYRFDFNKLTLAHGSCFREFIRHLSEEVNLVIVDNTNTTPVEISPYILGAQAFNYQVSIHRIECDPELAASRNTHGVPVAGVKAQADRIAAGGLMPWWTVETIQAWKA